MVELKIRTSRRIEARDITDEVRRAADGKDGHSVHLFCLHTTCGLTINENADPAVMTRFDRCVRQAGARRLPVQARRRQLRCPHQVFPCRLFPYHSIVRGGSRAWDVARHLPDGVRRAPGKKNCPYRGQIICGVCDEITANSASICRSFGRLRPCFLAGPLHAAKDDVPTPKEYGVYVKTATKLVRILPNIVFQDGAMLYIESNNPPHFPLKDIKYFIFYGKHGHAIPHLQ